MKKGLLVGASLLFLCTGCSLGGGEKNLVCTNTQSESGVNIVSTAEMNFKSDKINNVKLTMDVTPESDLMKNNWSYVEDAYDDLYKDVTKDGLKVSTKVDSENKKYSIIIEADPAKVTKEDLSKYGMGDIAGAEDTYAQKKSDFESEGYTCK